MSDKVEETAGDVTMNYSEINFDKLIIMKEFDNIVNLVSPRYSLYLAKQGSPSLADVTLLHEAPKQPASISQVFMNSLMDDGSTDDDKQAYLHIIYEDFLEIVPKAKLRRVKWVPMFDCLKQGILDEMVQELTAMWEDENMPDKLDQLEKQKEKFGEINEDQILWRPQLGDVKAQLRASDAANLKKQKTLLESLALEYEVRVNRLKKVLSAKRGYIKALDMDIHKHQKKHEEFIANNINEKLKNHDNIMKCILHDKVDVEELSWSEKDMD